MRSQTLVQRIKLNFEKKLKTRNFVNPKNIGRVTVDFTDWWKAATWNGGLSIREFKVMQY